MITKSLSTTCAVLTASILASSAQNSSSGDFLEGIPGTSGLWSDNWDVTGAAGLALAKGNADSLSYSLQALATYEGEQWEGLLGADYFYSENEGVTATDSLRIFGQGQRLLSDRFYVGVAGSFLQDEVADLDYRFDVASVFGYHLLKNDRTTLSLEIGPGYTWEEQGGLSDSYASLRFAQRFEHKLNSRSKIWQNLIVTPQIDDFANYNLIAEAGLDVLLTEKWAFRTTARYLYDNTPAADRQKDDLALTVGLAYSLGGFPEPEEEGRRTLKPDREEPEVAAMGWTTTAALGLTLASGNADNLQANLSYDTAFRASTHEFFANGSYSLGQNNGETAIDALRLGTRFNRLLSERFYFGAGLDYLRDDIADLSYRVAGNAYAGRYFLKNETMSLAFEGGVGYLWEESAGVADNYLTLRAAERFSWVLGPRMTFKQDAILDLDPGDFDNFLLTVTAYLDTDITDSLSWRLAGTYVYDNQPAGLLENSDTTLTSGIAVQF